MNDGWKGLVSRTLAGRDRASPGAIARVEADLARAAPVAPSPPGLRRSIIAALNDEALADRATPAAARRPISAHSHISARSRTGALIGRWSLLAAACLGLGLSVLALRTPVPTGQYAGGPTTGGAKPGDATGVAGSALSPRRLEAVMRTIPSRVEAPLADEARRLRQDAQRAAQLVAAAWRPVRGAPAPGSAPGITPGITPGAVPGIAPAIGPLAPAGSPPSTAPHAG